MRIPVSLGERKRNRTQKIILRSQKFGLQKSGNNADLGFSSRDEEIVPLVFFRWNFFYRKQKTVKFLIF